VISVDEIQALPDGRATAPAGLSCRVAAFMNSGDRYLGHWPRLITCRAFGLRLTSSPLRIRSHKASRKPGKPTAESVPCLECLWSRRFLCALQIESGVEPLHSKFSRPLKRDPISLSSTRSVVMNLARRFNAGNGQWRNDARRVSDD
jgi:hypothetical protein